ncbi:MAG: hypothetical protein ACFFD7_10155 [Candidatus Thorarchaeota archaeon]
MKARSKVIMAITVVLLISTIASATSVGAVKAGTVVKVHLSAEGAGIWDPTANILITANVEHNYVSSWTEKASFKKIGINPITNEEVMLYHGRLKDGVAYFLEWWQDPNSGQWWQYVWIIQGTGVVKTRTNTYPEAYITILFTLGGDWAYAAFEDPDTGDSGPTNPVTGLGCVTVPIVWEEIGVNQFDFIKQEQDTVLDVWLNGENRITNNYEGHIAETHYIIVGMLQTEQEKRDKVFMQPWAWTMIMDGWETIELKTFWWNDEEGILIGEPTKVLVFYHIYEPWTLGWGVHTIDHEVSWYNGVGSHAWQETIGWQWNFAITYW